MTNTLAELLEKYKNGAITPAEWQQLREAVLSDNSQELIQNDILLQLQSGSPAAGWKKEDAETILRHILSADEDQHTQPTIHRVHFLRTALFRYAAAIILIAGIAGYAWFQYNSSKPQNDPTTSAPSMAIKAAHNGAVLTLADGSNIVLDTMTNRLITAQDGSRVLLKNGQLVYAPATATAGRTVYNTITTAKGKQFNLLLPDGTKVYLNAASSLRYPTAFTGNDRSVEVSGEAYFEIAKNASQPFKVTIDQQTQTSKTQTSIEVLGTSFNVNAYKDENSINTTLVEGSVRIMKNEQTTVLFPGEQARVTDRISLIKNADVSKAVAWKNGIFNFEGLGLREMMRQLERWYDIEVIYSDNVPDQKFFGKISRKVDLATVLEGLKGFGVHFEMRTDRKLIVTQ